MAALTTSVRKLQLRLPERCASSRVSVARGNMCLIAWLILGLIGGWVVASQGVNNSGASDFRPPPPQIFRQPVPCAPGKRSIRGSVSPEILESIRRQGRVHRRARDRAVPQPPLNRPGIVPPVGQRIAAGMAKQVRVSLQLKAEPKAGNPLDHLGKATGREWRPPLADEDIRRRRAFPQQPSQGYFEGDGCRTCHS